MLVTHSGDKKSQAVFIRRDPACCGRKAVSYFRFPGFAGQNGADDDGTTPLSDYDVSRKVEVLV
ncbi:hypothetical protein [Zhongshania aliphaticivorans]|uniref:hypothetical protein n=1 Tax=Zhongshania aliphaticivorans TaxID=1470434 RepID=UPI001330D729|nr:hypothetical protein [Zhongshania aliphaticivorans]